MALNSPVDVIESQIRECYGRVVWTHKTQEKCADILNSRQDRLKLWQIILSAVTTSGILVSVIGDSKPAGISAAIISVSLTILNAYTKKYDLGGMAQKHADAAVSIWNIRESYLSLLTDIRACDLDCDKICAIRDKLQTDLHKVYKGTPRTINKAYQEASKALMKMEEMTFSDEEIDKLLPKSLRKTNT